MTRVLIVDDKQDNLYYLEALLNGNGYVTDTARHGAEALNLARQTVPDIVVSDLLMPVMDGYTLLRHWKRDPALKDVPFIVYTATYTAPEDEELAVSLGADAFILKPAEPATFLETLRGARSGTRNGPSTRAEQQAGDDETLLKDYSQTLVRKLEDKMLQLEEANQELQLDIARRQEAEKKIEQLAFYDPLTGLPNRHLLQDRLQQCIAASSRQHSYSALLFIDLDNFKTLNDTKGHNVGDRLLVMVAERLQSCTREGDTVARFGGDEFLIILETLSASPEQSAALAEAAGDRILADLSRPYPQQGGDYHGTACIGVSLFRDKEVTAEELIRRADTAMYQAKHSGRNNLYFYDPAMQAALESRLQLENDLRRALAEQEFRLHYQPQVDQDGRVVGAEALIRWLSPDRGLVPPGEFIPLAEETGLIVPIGRWVIQTACQKLKAWERAPALAAMQLAVNVSARQFHQSEFVAQIISIIRHEEINPALLKLELTESVILDNIESATARINELKRAGVSFSMDDFGTGYSSLSYLTHLPLDQLKIDQSFIHNMEATSVNAAIVQTIIDMARNLGMEAIAEGVETGSQYNFLKAHGCRLFQGYHFGRPVPVEELEAGLHPN